jgi:hypothetical protein
MTPSRATIAGGIEQRTRGKGMAAEPAASGGEGAREREGAVEECIGIKVRGEAAGMGEGAASG